MDKSGVFRLHDLFKCFGINFHTSRLFTTSLSCGRPSSAYRSARTATSDSDHRLWAQKKNPIDRRKNQIYFRTGGKADTTLNGTNPPFVPTLAPHTRRDNEQIIRIVAFFDGVQLRVIRAKELRLEVWLVHVRLVRVRRAQAVVARQLLYDRQLGGLEVSAQHIDLGEGRLVRPEIACEQLSGGKLSFRGGR
jgi:hypothetical protein